MLRVIIWSFLSLCAGAAGAVALLAAAPKSEADAVAPNASPERLAQEIEALRREVAVIGKKSVAPALVAAQLASASRPAPTGRTRRTAEPRLPLAEVKRARLAAYDTHLASEGVDPAWSASRQKELSAGVAESLPGSRVATVSCGTTMCRLVLEHHEEGSEDDVIASLLAGPTFATETTLFKDPAATPRRTTIYVARAGRKLPRP